MFYKILMPNQYESKIISHMAMKKVIRIHFERFLNRPKSLISALIHQSKKRFCETFRFHMSFFELIFPRGFIKWYHLKKTLEI